MALVCVLWAGASGASYAQPVWSLDVGVERSDVATGPTSATWETARVQMGVVRPETGGWFAAVERQRRGRLVDFALSTGAYRRLGDWTIAGGAAGSIEPTFLYGVSVEAEVSRRVVGTAVVSLGYRLLDFAAATVHQFQPALTWYHRRGEVQGRLYATRKGPRARSSLTGLWSTSFDVAPRLRVSGAVAYGDRIFDVASLPSAQAPARSMNIRARVAVTGHDFIEIGGGVAHEDPSFEQRTLSLMYRRTF